MRNFKIEDSKIKPFEVFQEWPKHLAKTMSVTSPEDFLEKTGLTGHISTADYLALGRNEALTDEKSSAALGELMEHQGLIKATTFEQIVARHSLPEAEQEEDRFKTKRQSAVKKHIVEVIRLSDEAITSINNIVRGTLQKDHTPEPPPPHIPHNHKKEARSAVVPPAPKQQPPEAIPLPEKKPEPKKNSKVPKVVEPNNKLGQMLETIREEANYSYVQLASRYGINNADAYKRLLSHELGPNQETQCFKGVSKKININNRLEGSPERFSAQEIKMLYDTPLEKPTPEVSGENSTLQQGGVSNEKVSKQR